MASVLLKEKLKDLFAKNKTSQQEETTGKIDSKYYDIFDLYYYVESGTENRPKIAYAYQKGDHYYDCKTGEFLPNPSIIRKCFGFSDIEIKNKKIMKGACYARWAEVNYLNHKIRFHYGMEGMCSWDDSWGNYRYFNSEDIKSYDENIIIKRDEYLQSCEPNFIIHYLSESDASVQPNPKLCLALTDLKKSEKAINSQLKKEYKEIDILVEESELDNLKKQKEEDEKQKEKDDYKKLANKIKERVV